jgi:hypothetical protein
MRKTLIRTWRRSGDAGGACCEGARCEVSSVMGANNLLAPAESPPATRLTLFCSGATTTAVAGALPGLPAQQAAHDNPRAPRDALPFSGVGEASPPSFSGVGEAPAPPQFIPACDSAGCARVSDFSCEGSCCSCEASCEVCSGESECRCGAFDAPILARQQSCSAGASVALASCTHQAEAAVASAPPHTPAVSVRSMPNMRTKRRINSWSFPSPTFDLR